MSGKVERPPKTANFFSKPIILKCRSAIRAAPSEPSLREVGDDHIGASFTLLEQAIRRMQSLDAIPLEGLPIPIRPGKIDG
jgi:hypothetical protein